jgi:diguanylate cyclase
MDELGLYRRLAFDRDLTERTAASAQQGEPLALVIIDLDKFKSINDLHGHPAGDEVLQLVARTIKQTVGIKGTSYRYGGDELSVLLPNYTADEAAARAERIRRLIETSLIGSKELRVTASFGIAEVPTHAKTSVELLKMADSALYEAKDLGRNLVRISGEPRPVAPKPRVTTRRAPDPSGITQDEAEKIRAEYFRYHHAYCPRDGSSLRFEELQSDEQRTPDLIISCPLCGLSERLAGL